MDEEAPPTEASWLLLIHQLPPQPAYFRVKIWRRLQGLGAVAIKSSVYALPAGDEPLEDFQWVLREIEDGGGEASICEARFIEGLSDGEVRELFHAARNGDYEQIAGEARDLLQTARSAEQIGEAAAQLGRLRRRLAQVAAIDFFGAPARRAAEDALLALENRLSAASADDEAVMESIERPDLSNVRGRVWVTRKDVHVDRMASAWLIRRFIDPEASFVFAPARGYRPRPGELRFDMFEAEFTHEGDRCTFEVLLDRARLSDPALRQIGEIVHDIDIKDAKYDRPEAAGIDRLLAGIALAQPQDEARIERAMAVFDDLHAYFRRKRRTPSGSRPARPE